MAPRVNPQTQLEYDRLSARLAQLEAELEEAAEQGDEAAVDMYEVAIGKQLDQMNTLMVAPPTPNPRS